MHALERQLSIQCEVDAFYVKSLESSPCPTKLKGEEFFSHEGIDGKTIWLNPPPGKEHVALLAYLKVKNRNPETQALVALPTSARGARHPWLHLLRGMQKVRSISKQNTGPWISEETGLPVEFRREMDILYDPPRAATQVWEDIEKDLALCVAGKVILPDMLFRGWAAQMQLIVLVDTGASASFISLRAAKAAGLRMERVAHQQGRGAGNAPIKIMGTVKIPLRLGSYTDTVEAYVVPDVLEGVDVVLGKLWQNQNRAIIDCGKQEIRLRPPGRSKVRIHPLVIQGARCTDTEEEPSDCTALSLISLAQAKKALRRGSPYFLMNVRQASEPTVPRDKESSPDGEAQADDPQAQNKESLATFEPGCTASAADPRAMAQHQCPDTQTKRDDEERTSTVLPGPPPLTAQMAEENGLLNPTELKELLSEYAETVLRDTLPDDPSKYRPVDDNQHVIKLVEGAQPPKQRARRMSPAELKLCDEYVKELLQKGFITPSTSPYGAPVLFIPKASGGHRVVCDWRALNALTIKNRYPLPRIDETLDKLGGAKLFSSLDLNSGYYQIRISEEDAHKTAFTTPFGLYEYKVLGQGLANAPATFQAVMNRVFAQHLNKFVVVYLDDILVFSDTPQQHMEHLRTVLEIMKENQFYAKPTKCHFGMKEVKFLGHIVGSGGIRPDPAKVQAVQEWPRPKDVQQVRQFLGLTNYFRKFIKDYAGTANPLVKLTHKTANVQKQWSKEHTEAFEALKEALVSAPLLVHPDYSKPFELVSDASLIGTGAVLLQEGRVVAYTSKKFSAAERNYTTTEHEMLGVVRALEEWRCHFTGSAEDLKLVTDHNPITYFDSKKSLTRRLERWVQFMSQFNYTWVYRKGADNVADPLSRSPALMLYTVLQYAAKRLSRRMAARRHCINRFAASVRNAKHARQACQHLRGDIVPPEGRATWSTLAPALAAQPSSEPGSSRMHAEQAERAEKARRRVTFQDDLQQGQQPQSGLQPQRQSQPQKRRRPPVVVVEQEQFRHSSSESEQDSAEEPPSARGRRGTPVAG